MYTCEVCKPGTWKIILLNFQRKSKSKGKHIIDHLYLLSTRTRYTSVYYTFYAMCITSHSTPRYNGLIFFILFFWGFLFLLPEGHRQRDDIRMFQIFTEIVSRRNFWLFTRWIHLLLSVQRVFFSPNDTYEG